MTLFQLFVVPLAVLFFVLGLVRFLYRDRRRLGALLWSGIWLGVAIAVQWPELTTGVAGRLGIGRGADLVLYLVAITFLVSVFFFYQKHRQLEAEITTLVRRLALREAAERWPQGPNVPPSSP